MTSCLHKLKTVKPWFVYAADGTKRFEVRVDDRGYLAGDVLCLREWTGSRYTGARCHVEVEFIFRGGVAGAGPLLAPGVVVLQTAEPSPCSCDPEEATCR